MPHHRHRHRQSVCRRQLPLLRLSVFSLLASSAHNIHPPNNTLFYIIQQQADLLFLNINIVFVVLLLILKTFICRWPPPCPADINCGIIGHWKIEENACSSVFIVIWSYVETTVVALTRVADEERADMLQSQHRDSYLIVCIVYPCVLLLCKSCKMVPLSSSDLI